MSSRRRSHLRAHNSLNNLQKWLQDNQKTLQAIKVVHHIQTASVPPQTTTLSTSTITTRQFGKDSSKCNRIINEEIGSSIQLGLIISNSINGGNELKCLLCACDFLSSEDAGVRYGLLGSFEGEPNITFSDVVTECHRIEILKKDTDLVQKACRQIKDSTVIHSVVAKQILQCETLIHSPDLHLLAGCAVNDISLTSVLSSYVYVNTVVKEGEEEIKNKQPDTNSENSSEHEERKLSVDNKSSKMAANLKDYEIRSMQELGSMESRSANT
ncbi:unnamed protein product [Hymenolepis diminuta]|uniref:Uncharacterized protein n=1 Tax=Hymenolepis diminuta TaxID=6216 RepID=A0A564Y1S8_HYMDI|nr:unnamed protein product [Hymenolepis diminuta]